jgi:hypothetical protein
MIGLVMAIELASSHCDQIGTWQSQIPLSWWKSSQAIADHEARADILCFGDSLVKLGVLPSVIEDRLGLSAYNLAVLAGQPASSFFLFRRALESGQRPRAVIVDFSAPLLAMSLRTSAECWAGIASCRDAIELAIEAGDPALGLDVMSRWLIPSQSRHRQFRAWLTGSAQCNGARDAAQECRVFERNWHLNRGAQVAPRQFIPIEGALPRPPDSDLYQWSPRAVHTAYVTRFLTLAKSRSIPVFWVLPPVVAVRRQRFEASGIAAAYHRFTATFLRAFPDVTILDGEGLQWDNRAFRDPIHLNKDGAVAFSKAIAETLAWRIASSRKAANLALTQAEGGGLPDQASAPRWVMLAAPAPQTSHSWESILEDLDQSRRALNRPGPPATT